MKATGRQSVAVRPVHRSDAGRSAVRAIPQNPQSSPESSPEDLIRSLADRLSSERREGPEPDMGDRTEEILFDAEIDGTRYLLVRMPKSEKIHLSPREHEIVRMVAEGHPNKVIADVLSISSWTVCTHLRRIFAKLGVGSRAAMVARLFDGRIPGQQI
jgi:DNA-binding CsgD family transcriptional regulator